MGESGMGAKPLGSSKGHHAQIPLRNLRPVPKKRDKVVYQGGDRMKCGQAQESRNIAQTYLDTYVFISNL
jgi:hypothetical protein